MGTDFYEIAGILLLFLLPAILVIFAVFKGGKGIRPSRLAVQNRRSIHPFPSNPGQMPSNLAQSLFSPDPMAHPPFVTMAPNQVELLPKGMMKGSQP